MDVGDAAVVDARGLDMLITVLSELGYDTRGPVVRDGAVMPGPVAGISDLPAGYRDAQGPGHYRLEHKGDRALFAWAVGPGSWKAEFFPPTQELWRATVDGAVTFSEPRELPTPIAIIGARPCEVAALDVLDRVLQSGEAPDPHYTAKRDGTFILTAECGAPAATCFCTSMGTGPAAGTGFDLALSELGDGHAQRYVVRVGTDRGAAVLARPQRCRHDRGPRRPPPDARIGYGRHDERTADRRATRPSGPQSRSPAMGGRGRPVLGVWELHLGLPHLLLQRRPRHHVADRRDLAPAVLGVVLRPRPLLPPRRSGSRFHFLAIPPMADPQAVYLVGPVRHVGLHRVRPVHRMVPGRHRPHRGSSRHLA